MLYQISKKEASCRSGANDCGDLLCKIVFEF